MTTPTDQTGLTQQLADYFEKPFSELPPDKQQLVLWGYSDGQSIAGKRWSTWLATWWDSISPDQRRAFAEQREWESDPANADIQEKAWHLQCEITDDLAWWDAKIDEWENLPRSERPAPKEHRSTLADFKDQRDAVRAQEKELLSAGRSEFHSVVEGIIERRDPCAKGASGMPAGVDGQPYASPGGQPAISGADFTAAVTRPKGRPSAKTTSLGIWDKRRQANVPFGDSKRAEAEAINADWPQDGPPKVQAKTVSGHISALWRQAKKQSDKLSDKLSEKL